MLVIFTDLKFTVCHNKPPCQNRFCFVHAVLTGICLTLLLWKRSGERCCRVTVCSVLTARGRKEGGGGSGADIRIRKKRKRQTEGRVGDNHEYLYSVQSRKEIRSKRKRKEKMEFSGGREADQYSSWPR